MRTFPLMFWTQNCWWDSGPLTCTCTVTSMATLCGRPLRIWRCEKGAKWRWPMPEVPVLTCQSTRCNSARLEWVQRLARAVNPCTRSVTRMWSWTIAPKSYRHLRIPHLACRRICSSFVANISPGISHSELLSMYVISIDTFFTVLYRTRNTTWNWRTIFSPVCLHHRYGTRGTSCQFLKIAGMHCLSPIWQKLSFNFFHSA